MHHTLERVARNNFLNERRFIAFARQPENQDRFSLSQSGMDLLVSTWYVGDLINAFKKTQSKEDLEKDRQQAIRDSQNIALC